MMEIVRLCVDKLSLLARYTNTDTSTNSIDRDETASNIRLIILFSMFPLFTLHFKIMHVSSFKDRRVYMKNIRGKRIFFNTTYVSFM